MSLLHLSLTRTLVMCQKMVIKINFLNRTYMYMCLASNCFQAVLLKGDYKENLKRMTGNIFKGKFSFLIPSM